MSGELFVNFKLAAFKSICFSAVKLRMQKQIEDGILLQFWGRLPESNWVTSPGVRFAGGFLATCIVLEGATDVIFLFFSLAVFQSFIKVDYLVGGFMKGNRVAIFEVVMNVVGTFFSTTKHKWMSLGLNKYKKMYLLLSQVIRFADPCTKLAHLLLL